MSPTKYLRCQRCKIGCIPAFVSPAAALSDRCHICGPHSPTLIRLAPIRPPPPRPPPRQRQPNISETNSDQTTQYQPPPTPTAKSFIETLEADKLAVSSLILKQLTDSGPCVVCSDEFNLGEKVNKLPCSHWFHTNCIIPWLNQKNNCPLCRHEFPVSDENDRSTTETTSTTTSSSTTPQTSDQSQPPEPSQGVRRTARIRAGMLPRRRLSER